MSKSLRVGLLALAVVVLAAAVFFLWRRTPSDTTGTPTVSPSDSGALPAASLKAAVLYDGTAQDQRWQDTYSQLDQSLLLDFACEAVDISKGYDLSGYDILYPAAAVMDSADADGLQAALVAFVRNGGSLFLLNDFYDFFEPDFIGAQEFVALSACPSALILPSVGGDWVETQELIADFHFLYQSYSDYTLLATYDYGVGVVPSTATALVEQDGLALYTVNAYGNGTVFFTNPLLPNEFSINGFAVVSRDSKQETLANTTASANQLLLNSFAAYVSKQRYGYAVSRVFGSFGRPSLAWELHFEDITGLSNDSAILFSELAKDYLQMPSFTLIRSTYYWLRRVESVNYVLGEAQEGGVAYNIDWDESIYSSGTHVVTDGQWLSLFVMNDTGSYFNDYPEYLPRAYPYVADFNGDGVLDLLCGSADGLFHYYIGQPFAERWTLGAAQQLTASDGTRLSVGGYSAPTMADVNGDGVVDLISGCDDGTVYWFAGGEGMTFEPMGQLLTTGFDGQTFPEAGDADNDGKLDLLVGSNQGVLLLYRGTSAAHLQLADTAIELSPLVAELGHWLAPRVVDLNGDGVTDLAVGTFSGYVARYLTQDGGYVWDGYYTTNEQNHKGNDNIKFNSNCVPYFADLNGDGILDLIAGALEYGMAYSIDSPYFPYRDELQRQIDYMQENGLYLGVHYLTGQYYSAEREAFELNAHIQAMASYGVDVNGLGANQHTWYTSSYSPTQTLSGIYKAGLLWESGFRPSKDPTAPEGSAKNVIALPFFLVEDGQKTLLVQNNSVLLYRDESWTDLSAKYGMPICIYYHCDLAYQSTDSANRKLTQVAAFIDTHSYNCVSEDQLMLTTAAAYNLVVHSQRGEGAALDVTLTPSAAATDFALYNADYQQSCGVRVSFAERYNAEEYTTDADVWLRDGQDLYLSLNRAARVYAAPAEGVHVERINIAASVTTTANGAVIEFLDGGMMQVVVNGSASTNDSGWIVTDKNGKTMFTKYGDAETLTIVY